MPIKNYKLKTLRFKSKVKDSEIRPGLLVLKLYFRWFALTHNGKLDARPTQSTLVWRVGRFSYMYADYYGEKIPEEVKDAVVYVSCLTLQTKREPY